MDQIVADAGPVLTGSLGSDVVRHSGGAWRKDSDVGSTFALEFQLGAFQAFADLVVADFQAVQRGC